MTSDEILKKCAELQISKRQDYTNDKTNQFENFDRSSLIASWFKNDIDKSFAVLIGTKLARLASLLNKDKEPNHESIEDTFIDLTNYCSLWGGKSITSRINKILPEYPIDNQTTIQSKRYQCKYCGVGFNDSPRSLDFY